MAETDTVNPEHGAQLPAAEAAEAVHGHEVAAGTEAAGHGGEGGGLPQFRMEYWGGQIVWLLILFAILFFLMQRVFIPRLRRALDEREGAISGAVAEARRVQAEADAQAEAGRSELAEARARAQRTAADAKAAAAAESARRQAEEEAVLNERLAAAEAGIRDTRDRAMANVRTIAADTASAMVERLTGRAPAADEVEAALSARGTA